MMIKFGLPYCDECGRQLQDLSEEQCLEDDFPGHGWTDWKTARKHYCYPCMDKVMDECNYPPCDICCSHRCEKGMECWANPPLHIFPYETYYANRVGEEWHPNINLEVKT